MFALRLARSLTASSVLAGLMIGGTQLALGSWAHAGTRTMLTVADVNLRSGPGTNHTVLRVLPRGTTVQATGDAVDGWVPVVVGGRRAWIVASCLVGAASNNPVGTNTGSVRTAFTLAGVNVRSGPELTAERIGALAQGAGLQLTGRLSGSWTQIRWRGATAWVNSAWVSAPRAGQPSAGTPATTGRSRATADLMVRDSSGTSFRVLGTISSGSLVQTTARRTSQVQQVLWQGSLRWVNARYLTVVGTSSQVSTPVVSTVGFRYATTALNIRSSSTGQGVVDEVPAGTKLAVTGLVANGRAQVVHQGAVRWVTAIYLTAGAPAPRSLAGGNLDVGGNVGLNAMTPAAKGIVAEVQQNFPQVQLMYGVRPDPLPDHPSGHAVDIMLPSYRSNRVLGQQIAAHMRAHAAELGIQYVIYHQHIWSVARSGEGWRLMADRGGDTANHFDHVHVTVN